MVLITLKLVFHYLILYYSFICASYRNQLVLNHPLEWHLQASSINTVISLGTLKLALNHFHYELKLVQLYIH